MIFSEDDILLNLNLDGNFYEKLTLGEVEYLLHDYKSSCGVLKSKEVFNIPDAFMYFAGDEDKNLFSIKIYKTLEGTDIWILFMMNNVEGYALYNNFSTNKLELAWYNANLKEPLSQEKEKEFITCYVPKVR